MKKNITFSFFFTITLLFSQVNQNEFLDPKSVREEFTIGKNNLNSENNSENIVDSTNATSNRKQMSGYRVQLLSTQRINKANYEKKRASRVLNQNVYIVFQTPYYKVRVGDFIEYKECRQFEKIAKEKGFYNAWTVRSLINY
ncbi:MAG: SPOR domain-containing protein [Candidatus Marinimicrobia bacterium]|nr:SPOR domain-containing protein [Candidatus Neomarinimicrobiota bacterium]